MPKFNFTPSACYEKVQHINNIQVSLLCESIPDHIKAPLLEHQFGLIEELSTMLSMLEQGIDLDDDSDNVESLQHVNVVS